MYELRYFNLLPVTEEKNIEDISELSRLLVTIKKELIDKAVSLKIINQVFSEDTTNSDLLKNIFSLRIISLEDINVKITKEKNDFFMQFFDENTIDETIKINIKLNKDDLKVKINKKTKLFM